MQEFALMVQMDIKLLARSCRKVIGDFFSILLVSFHFMLSDLVTQEAIL